jgi:predicted GH43/DUF377 family glycosyl hydrolase
MKRARIKNGFAGTIMKINRLKIAIPCLVCIASLLQSDAIAAGLPYLSGVTDQGIVLRPDASGGANYQWDGGGVREANINKEGTTYYLYYDGAATFGENLWRACCATSTDLVHWTKQGKKLNAAIDDDPSGVAKGYRDWKSASSPWIIKEGATYYMFYLGCLNVFGVGIPSSPYYTLLATSTSISGPWTKRNAAAGMEKQVPFYTDVLHECSAPGCVIVNPKWTGTSDVVNKRYILFTCGSFAMSIVRTNDLSTSDAYDAANPNFWSYDPNYLFPPEDCTENSSMYYEPSNGYYFLFVNHIRTPQKDYTDAAWVYWTKDIDHWDQNNKAIVIDSSLSAWAKGAIGMPTVVKIDSAKLAIYYDGCVGNGTGHLGRSIGLAYVKLPLQPPASNKRRASIYITADNAYQLYVNGTLIGSDTNWSAAEKYSLTLNQGKNVVAVKAINSSGAYGLLTEVAHDDIWIESGVDWKTNTQLQSGWNTVGFNDTTWAHASAVASYGSAPWNIVSGMADGTVAKWMWSPVTTADTVYFRYVITVPNDSSMGIAPRSGHIKASKMPMSSLNISRNGEDIQIHCAGEYVLRIYDALGGMLSVQRGNTTGQFSFRQNAFSRGIYFAQLISAGKTITRRVVCE